MSLAQRLSSMLSSLGEPGPKPRDEDIDFCGLTDVGKVRKENQDQFLICTVHHHVVIHGTSLSDADQLPLQSQRLASIMLVADGVALSGGGRDASRLAVETIVKYVSSTMKTFTLAGETADKEFRDVLRNAALEAHAAVGAESAVHPGRTRLATTLTMAVSVWPNMYVIQVGDSRCYYFYNDQLRLVTRDQTMAQALVDHGALPAKDLPASPLRHVLASAIGGEEATPEVTRVELRPKCQVLLCSDGLTKHVSDEEIAQHLRTASSSEDLCRALVDLALARGGSDNVTVVVGRSRAR
jgi:protein phosphatase